MEFILALLIPFLFTQWISISKADEYSTAINKGSTALQKQFQLETYEKNLTKEIPLQNELGSVMIVYKFMNKDGQIKFHLDESSSFSLKKESASFTYRFSTY